MKAEQIYQNLKELAEKLDIDFSEQNFRKTGIPLRSGICKVDGKTRFLMDKHLSLKNKIEVLAESLAGMSIDKIFIIPVLRDILNQYKKPNHTDPNDLEQLTPPSIKDDSDETGEDSNQDEISSP